MVLGWRNYSNLPIKIEKFKIISRNVKLWEQVGIPLKVVNGYIRDAILPSFLILTRLPIKISLLLVVIGWLSFLGT